MRLRITKRAFPDGTYFTGKDRECFPRSLYEYISFDLANGTHKLRHLFLCGFHSDPISHVFDVVEGDNFPIINKEYREATREEIVKYFETFGCEPPTAYDNQESWTDETGSWKGRQK